MKKKLLNPKKYERTCETCLNGRTMPDGETVLCPKKGVAPLDGACRGYKYDPLKRSPRKAPAFESANPEDFKL